MCFYFLVVLAGVPGELLTANVALQTVLVELRHHSQSLWQVRGNNNCVLYHVAPQSVLDINIIIR